MVGYLGFNGAIFLLIGLRCLFKPVDAVAVPYGLVADTVDARNYLRASAGGVTVVCGGVLIAGALVSAMTLPALVLAVALFGGLVFGRLVSLVADGQPGMVPYFAGTLELLGFLFGAYWLVFLLRPA